MVIFLKMNEIILKYQNNMNQHNGCKKISFSAFLPLYPSHYDCYDKQDKRRNHKDHKAFLNCLTLGIDSDCRRNGAPAEKTDSKYNPESAPV